MKMFRKTEDGAIDNLLRAQAGRIGGPPPLCPEFDPDLANAYIEHSLPVSARARYEQHLSLCASCRKSVVGLSRMAQSDTVFAASDGSARAAGLPPEPRWRALLGAMSRPQWAMAAAAIIIVVVSVPLFLSRSGAGVDELPAQSKLAQPSPSADARAGAEQANPPGRMTDGMQQGMAQQAANAQPEKGAPKPPRAAEDSGQEFGQPAAGTAPAITAAAVARSEPPQTQPVEAKTADPNADQIASSEASQVPVPPAAAAPEPEQVARENQLAKIDPDQAKSVSEQDKEKAEVSLLQPGRPDGESRSRRDAVVRSNDIVPPPSPAPGTRGRNAMAAAPGGGINSRLTDPARHRSPVSERKVGGKKFWLKDGTWVDKDYNPDKDMPVVTFVRDSDVYKEHVARRQGMKSYLSGFAENERIIFIYKGTVYIIVPQEGTK